MQVERLSRVYLWPYCCTPLASWMSSLFDHCPFFSPPATELCHLLRQSLFVRPGSFVAILHLEESISNVV